WKMYSKRLSGPAVEEPLLPAAQLDYPRDISHDGRFVLFDRGDLSSGSDIWVLPLSGERKAQPLLHSAAIEVDGRLSPDGRGIAYVSDEHGTADVLVQPMPPTGSKWQISRGGGGEPAWRADGNELFYVGADNTIMAAPVRREPSFQPGPPVPLFGLGRAAQRPARAD